jgi:hypothetical protein
VAPDLGFVAHAAEREPQEFPVEGARDRPAERRLAHAGRPHEAQDRAFRLGRELAHGEELDDPHLDLLEVVVVLVEDLPRPREVEIVLGDVSPRQACEPVEIRA